MNDKENNINYTAEDITQYLTGKLSPLQMHAMEKAALDDPFLAEAMEGYAGIQQEDWKGQLAILKNELGQEKKQAKVIALPKQRKNNWWKIAAAVLLIGGTATISYLLVNKKATNDLAEKDVIPSIKATPADTIKATAPVNSESTTVASVTPAVKPNASLGNKQYLTADKNTIASTGTPASDSAFVYTPAKKDAKPMAKDGESKVSGDVSNNNATASANVTTPPAVNNNNYGYSGIKAEEQKSNYNALNNKSGVLSKAQYEKIAASNDAFANFKKEAPLNKNFSAQVVGPDNSPLPFANISIKSENFGTYADAKGNFRLVSSDSVLTVEVKAAGYQPKFYTLQSFAQQNKIVLAEEDAASRYKTVSGNASTAKARISRRATLLKDSLVNVEPADGWDNYNTYVDNNIEIPDDILKKDIHGQVEVSFDVNSNGTITNIKVDKSLCNNCDEVAKRLIEQGPQWKVKKGKKGKGKVTVQF